jgi:subfamily B ATP-binding cassette protein MsbA
MKNGLQTYLRLLDYGRKYWFVFSIGVLDMLIFAVTDTGFAFLIKILTDSFAGNMDSFDTGNLKWVLPVGVIVIFIIRGISGFFSTYNMSWISRHVIRRVRSDVYQKFLYLPTSFLDQKSNADLLSKVIFNIEQVSESTANVLTVLIRDTLTIIVLSIYMVYLSPMLSAVIFTASPVIALIVKILSTLFRKYSERIQDSMGDVTHSIKETLQNHRIIKIFNGQEGEGTRFAQINEINRRHHMKLLRTKAIGDALTIFVASLGVAGVVFVCTRVEVK